MSTVVLAFGLLLLLSLAAGAVAMRFLGRHLPATTRLALTPVLGAALLCLLCLLVFLLVPLGPTASKIVYLPLAPWLYFLLKDRRARLRPATIMPVLALFALAAAVVFVPFVWIGGAEALGIHNNDAFYFASQDWRVSMHTFFGRGPVPFSIDPDATWVKRWGVDYMSVFLRHTFGLRSYQTAQIAAGFGLFLSACATFALARAARLHWAAALLSGVVAIGNHFAFKLYVDGMLGFTFGMPFAIGLLALLLRSTNSWRHGTLAGIAAAGLTMSYYELIPTVGVMVIVTLLRRFGTEWRWRTLAAGGAVALVVSAVFIPPMLDMFQYAQGVRFVTKYFNLSDPGGTFAHLLGPHDLYEYTDASLSPEAWQYVGAALATVCLVLVKPRARVLPAVAVAVGIGAYFLFAKDLQYQANRMLTIAWILLPSVLFSWVRERKGFAIAVITAGFLLAPIPRLTKLAAESDITTSARERDIGEWLAKLPKDAKLLIDVPDDVQIWHAHWMYLEAVHAFAGDDSRVVIPHMRNSYIYPVRPAPDRADLRGVTHILRRKLPGRVEANADWIEGNEDYLLFRVRQPLFWIWGKGFFGVEPSGSSWMGQSGTVVVHADGGSLNRTLWFTLLANAAMGPSPVAVLVNGSPIATVQAIQASKDQSVPVVLRPGRNEITFRAFQPAAALAPGDPRIATIYLGALRFQ